MSIEQTPEGTPYLSDRSYLSETPPYTRDLSARIDELAALITGSGIPIGTVVPYMGGPGQGYNPDVQPYQPTAPNFWLMCDGRSYSPDYFNVLFTQVSPYPYFHNDGVPRVPDLRGRAPMGQTWIRYMEHSPDFPPGNYYGPTTAIDSGGRDGDWQMQRHTHWNGTKEDIAGAYTGAVPVGGTGGEWSTTYHGGGSQENLSPYTGINFIVYTGKPTIDENGEILTECWQWGIPSDPLPPRTTRQMIEDRLAAEGLDEAEAQMLREHLAEIEQTEASE